MKRRTLAVSVAATLVALVAASAQAADGVTVSRFPVSFSFFNPCTNENVAISGTVVAVVDTTPDDQGLTGHSVDIALNGIGQTTGAQYILVGTNTVTDIEPDNGALVETTTTYSRLVVPGPGNDLLFAIVFHETIDANGDLAVEFNRLIPGVCT